jgi:hypothetical protein
MEALWIVPLKMKGLLVAKMVLTYEYDSEEGEGPAAHRNLESQ